jgi:neutral ceramidase
VAAGAEPFAEGPLMVASRSVELPMRSFPPREENEARLREARHRVEELATVGAEPGRLRLAQSLVEGHTAERLLAQRRQLLETEAEVTGIRLGDLALLAAPGELFTSVGRAIRARSPFDRIMVVGYAGGHVGYVPDREAYESGGYEALVTWLEPSAAGLLVETAAGVLSDLAEGRT